MSGLELTTVCMILYSNVLLTLFMNPCVSLLNDSIPFMEIISDLCR
jgi:hypothetical protein